MFFENTRMKHLLGTKLIQKIENSNCFREILTETIAYLTNNAINSRQ